ncbi:hypothetical protein CBOM_07361 [Ceraceosorus bombacis]|uniref:Uncharacterized protein n=1 Tax=Ceraceosorus bombacis TaxID=401625 RepID=A0A0P1B9L4_9BASI|nr:hypothetical protein CBOM_07361 [Ceraceosorus bombacis]
MASLGLTAMEPFFAASPGQSTLLAEQIWALTKSGEKKPSPATPSPFKPLGMPATQTPGFSAASSGRPALPKLSPTTSPLRLPVSSLRIPSSKLQGMKLYAGLQTLLQKHRQQEESQGPLEGSGIKLLTKTALQQPLHKADQEHLQKEVQIKCEELEEKVEVLASENERLKLASKFQWSKYLIFGLVLAAVAVTMITLWHFAGDELTEWARHPNKVPEWLVDYLKLCPTVTIEIPPLHWLDKAKLGVSNFRQQGLDLRVEGLDLQVNNTSFLEAERLLSAASQLCTTASNTNQVHGRLSNTHIGFICHWQDVQHSLHAQTQQIIAEQHQEMQRLCLTFSGKLAQIQAQHNAELVSLCKRQEMDLAALCAENKELKRKTKELEVP